MPASSRAERFASALPTVLCIASFATLVQSFVLVKLTCLAMFLLASISNPALRKEAATYPRLVWFYGCLSAVGILSAIVGWSHGNSSIAVIEGLRLRVLWSLAFLVIYTLLRSQRSLARIHAAMVVSGILISAINLVGLFDQALGWGLIPDDVRKQLELFAGFHDGYIQITSNNIGALFLIVPYLLALQCRSDAGKANSGWTKLSLALCLIVVAVSGRRALWLVVGLTPGLILLLSYVTNSLGALRARGRRLLVAYCVLAVLAVGLVAGMSLGIGTLQEAGYVRYFQAAFSADDVRSIQKDYLVAAFLESPVFGSGFGGYTDYLRSDERPWTYELTYYQMLFNLGVVGVALLVALFWRYLRFVITLLRRFRKRAAIPFGLMVAFCSLLLGAFSNPYLGSFDYLFFVGLLPYLSTFQRGFDAPVPRAGERAWFKSRVARQPQIAGARAARTGP